MPRTDRNQTFNQQGQMIAETIVQVPIPVVSDADFQQAKSTLRTMMQTFYAGGAPTGTPTNTQLRNWLIALTMGLRYVVNEMDNEG
jgi:hypothetical protein